MPDKKRQLMVFPQKGLHAGDTDVRGIYSELTDKIVGELGTKSTSRASHVEPTAELSEAALKYLRDNGTPEEWLKRDLWWADMIPSGGPVLGPFAQRDEALAHEVHWLNRKGIPVCGSCRNTEAPDVNNDGTPTADGDSS